MITSEQLQAIKERLGSLNTKVVEIDKLEKLAYQDVPLLIQEVERLKKENVEMRSAIAAHDTSMNDFEYSTKHREGELLIEIERLRNGLQYLINFPIHIHGDKTVRKMKSTAKEIWSGRL